MAEKIASLFAEIGADTSKFERGLSTTRTGLQGAAGEIKKYSTTFNQDFLRGLDKGSATMQDFGQQLVASADKAGLGASEISRMAQSTGAFSDQQILAARSTANVARKADELVGAVQRGEMTTREAGKAFQEYAKSQEVAVKSTTSFKEGLIGIASKAALIGGALVAAGAVAKKAFDFAEQGAQVLQTAESFDLLLQKVGAAPDLLNQLRRASNGTITDFQLMSSTATLLAGVQGKLAVELANTTPELLEIAKAANKLNPSLGDTTFLYQSLATGIKRGSPLLIDNTGLTLKLGEANEELARQLGKSVDELTEEEKKMAILNATLKAGRTLINQVGGSTESATDSFQRLKTSWGNLVDIGKTELVPTMTKVADKLDKFVQDSLEFTQVENELNLAYERGIITLDEYANSVAAIQNGTIKASEIQAILTQKVDRFNRELVTASAGAASFDKALMNLNNTAGKAGEGLEEVGEETEEAGKAAAEAEPKFRKLYQTLDSDPGSMIASLIKDLKWLQAGGFKINQFVEQVKQGLETGAITPEQGLKFLEGAFIASEALQVKIGEINANEAAKNIQDELGGSLLDAKQKVLDIDAAMKAFTSKTWQTTVLVKYQEQGKPAVISGDIIISGGKKQKRGVPIGAQHGLNMIVPPGFSNDKYPIMVSSGEHVQVTPSGKGGGEQPNFIYITQQYFDRGAAAIGQASINQLWRKRLNASMGM